MYFCILLLRFLSWINLYGENKVRVVDLILEVKCDEYGLN